MTDFIENHILQFLSNHPSLVTLDVSKELNVPHQEVIRCCKSLEADEYVSSVLQSFHGWCLTEEGKKYAQEGTPEFRIQRLLLSEEKIMESQVESWLGPNLIGAVVGNGIKRKLFKVAKTSEGLIFQRFPGITLEKDQIDEIQEGLKSILNGETIDKRISDQLLRRKLAHTEQIKVFVITPGPQYAIQRRPKAVGDLTRAMLKNESWKTATFKQYNLKASGKEPMSGALHPLLKIRQEFREIFLEMGFQEMHTQQWVDVSLWNFDAVFVPQLHPARDLQDTFFISKPECAQPGPEEFTRKLCQQHEKSYKCPWSEKEALRNVLRTHTTGSSAYWLYHLAQKSSLDSNNKRIFQPGRYFSIDRVFRNEEMDRTHLCEFHQIEGFIIDRNLTLGHMMHTFKTFFSRIGIEDLRFKPTYNPYTEPSLEIFGYHKSLKKWMEVGNSGMFRPEMLSMLGFDEDVSVIAWGLSLERPTMIKYGLNNIHELFGHKVNLSFVRRSMLAIF